MAQMSCEASNARRLLNKKWREDNREKINKYQKKWRKDNPDKIKEYQARYYEKKAKELQEKGVI